MFSRISKVDTLHAKIISFSSIMQIGDCQFIDGNSEALAIQRRSDILHTQEKDFRDYPIFQAPSIYLPIIEPVYMKVNNLQPFISVGSIKVTGVSSSSILSIGNTDHIRMRSRVMHVRDISNGNTPTEGTVQLQNENIPVRSTEM